MALISRSMELINRLMPSIYRIMLLINATNWIFSPVPSQPLLATSHMRAGQPWSGKKGNKEGRTWASGKTGFEYVRQSWNYQDFHFMRLKIWGSIFKMKTNFDKFGIEIKINSHEIRNVNMSIACFQDLGSILKLMESCFRQISIICWHVSFWFSSVSSCFVDLCVF